MPSSKIVPVILSGGSGTRLWPLSRELYPKQFHRLASAELTLFQETVMRFSRSPAFARPLIVTSEAHRFVLGAQLQEVGVSPSSIVLEPSAQGTASAILAAALSPGGSDDDLLLALPTDHFFENSEAFRKSVVEASPAAAEGRIVVFGVKPNRPDTGLGYVKAGATLNGEPNLCAIS